MARKQARKSTGNMEKLPRGQMGPAIVAEVERIVSEEGISKTEAFKRIAQGTGRSVGTVSVTYYRLTGKKRKATAPGRRRGRPKGSGKAPKARSVSRALQELAKLILNQEREIEQLRKENAMFAEIRRLLA
jgi:hypothetical protein